MGFYGTLLLNLSTSDSSQLGQDVPLWPDQGDALITSPDGTPQRAGIVRETFFTARQTILGFEIGPAKAPENGWNPSAVVEFDFFGSHQANPYLLPQHRIFNLPCLRLAYFQLEKGTWRIEAGQDQAIIAPLVPVSLSHVAIPLGGSAGDLWGWWPQVRVENSLVLGGTSVLFQVGALWPSFTDSRFAYPTAGGAIGAAYADAGKRSAQPFYQARVALSRPLAGSVATVGAGAHHGREHVGAGRTVESWAFALDSSIPLSRRLILRGEAFVNSNLFPFEGGVTQGVAAAPDNPPFTSTRPIHDAGGWAEITVPITLNSSNIFYAGAGTDDPRDRDLLPGTGNSKNSFLWASYFHKLTSDVTLALEWSNWDFQTRTFSPAGVLGPRDTSGRANVFNLALAYQF